MHIANSNQSSTTIRSAAPGLRFHGGQPPAISGSPEAGNNHSGEGASDVALCYVFASM
jgi:hypothetical protein